jgi:(R,R)-butanediol dehydrogenase / meso-butanediol dehydrogenase / diacetyl reductase
MHLHEKERDNKHMKAAVYYGPGRVQVEQVDEPGSPGPEEVVIQVQMGAPCGTDASQFKEATMIPLAHPHPASGHVGPVILGHEVVGVVVDKGSNVAHLEIGARVVPGAGMWCGACAQCRQGRTNICQRSYLFGIHAHGGLAELAMFPAKMCLPVPAGCSTEAAVMAQPCAVALHALLRGGITPAQTVALFGVGSIGSLLLATMQARAGGCQQVIAVDVERGRLETARKLGATSLIDARSDDPVAALCQLTGGEGVDLSIDATGVPATIAQALASLRRGGRLLQVGIPLHPVSLALDQAVQQEKDIVTTNGQICAVDLPQALDLLATTDLAARVGYQVIPLDALVQEGLVPLAEQRAKVLVAILHA